MKRSRTTYSQLESLSSLPSHLDRAEELARFSGKHKKSSYPWDTSYSDRPRMDANASIASWRKGLFEAAPAKTKRGSNNIRNRSDTAKRLAMSRSYDTYPPLNSAVCEIKANRVTLKAPVFKFGMEQQEESVALSSSSSKNSIAIEFVSQNEFGACTSTEDISDIDKSFDTDVPSDSSNSPETTTGSTCSGSGGEESDEGAVFF